MVDFGFPGYISVWYICSKHDRNKDDPSAENDKVDSSIRCKQNQKNGEELLWELHTIWQTSNIIHGDVHFQNL